MNSQEMAQAFFEDLKEKERLDYQMGELNKKIFSTSEKLYEQMEAEGVESIKIDGIEFKPVVEQDFSLAGDLKGAKWDDCGVWFKWLKEVGEKGLIKTKETVPANTRKKFLKEWIESNKTLPEFIAEKFFNTVKYNKSKIATMVEIEMSKHEA